MARLERPVLRSWSRPPPAQQSPVNVEVVWPAQALVGTTGTMRVLLRQEHAEPSEVDVRVPLPPGVTLAAPTKGMMQLQGVLAIRELVGPAGAMVEAPIRFGLAGTLTVPEATAHMTRSPTTPATAPARTLTIR
jgi:hypothetical protein